MVNRLLRAIRWLQSSKYAINWLSNCNSRLLGCTTTGSSSMFIKTSTHGWFQTIEILIISSPVTMNSIVVTGSSAPPLFAEHLRFKNEMGSSISLQEGTYTLHIHPSVTTKLLVRVISIFWCAALWYHSRCLLKCPKVSTKQQGDWEEQHGPW